MSVSQFAVSEYSKTTISAAAVRRRAVALSRASLIETLEKRQLLSATIAVVNPNAVPGSNSVIFDYIQNPDTTVPNVEHSQQTLQITDTGASALNISSINITGPWQFVGAPAGGYTNVTVTPSTPLTITLAFNQRTLPAHSYNETNYTTNTNGGAAISGSLTINSNDPVTPSEVVPLAGYWQNESNNNEEPSLQTIANLVAGYQTNINSTPVPDLTEPTSPTSAQLYGSEVAAVSWEAASASSPVVIQELATFRTQGNPATIYWYGASGQQSHELYQVPGNEGQTLLPTLDDGGAAQASFTPGGAFGIRVDNEYSTDSINTANGNTGGGGHHFRFFPLLTATGTAVPNTYLVSMDYGVQQDENFDFQDNVFVVSNIRPSGTPATPSNFTATAATSPVLSWTADAYSPVVYNVYSSASAAGPFTLLTTTAGTTYTDTSNPTSAIYYQLTAEDNTQTPVTVSPPATAFVNTGPVTSPVTINTYSGTPVTFNPLSSATDSSGTFVPSTVAVSAAGHGTATVNASNGSITYTPLSSFSGTDTFTYTVRDTNGRVAAAETVTAKVLAVTVALVAPVANNETVTTLENDPVQISVLSVDNPTTSFNVSSVKITTQPASGNVSVNTSTGVVTYTPGLNFVGGDSFQYTVADNNGLTSNIGIININAGTEISSAKGAFKSLVYNDENGTPVTISINRGVADVYFDGTGTVVSSLRGKITVAGSGLRARQITLSGTTTASVLSITGKNKGQVNLGGISDAGPLGSISAATTNLAASGSSGPLAGTALLTSAITTVGTPITAAGTLQLAGVRSISLRTATDSDITLGGTGVLSTSVVFAGVVVDSGLTSSVALSNVKASKWTDTNTTTYSEDVVLSAPSIANLAIGGEFDAALTLNSTGRTAALGNARITGAASISHWSINGNAHSIFLGSAPATWGGLLVTGNLASFVIANGGLTADVTAGSINTLKVAGVISSDITTTGNLLSLQAAQLVDALVDVGTTANTVAVATTANIGASLLGNLHLTSKAADTFSDSNVIADRINTASIGAVNAANGGTPEGIAAVTFKSAALRVDNGVLHLNAKDLLSESALTAFLGLKGATLGTFAIDIV